MYKIMTKLHTSRENVFAFHMVTNDRDEIVEYAVGTPEEAAITALELLGRVGYEDLRIVDDKSYYLDLIYGKKPIPEPNLYVLTYENIEGYAPDAEKIENIEEGATVSSLITFVIYIYLVTNELKSDKSARADCPLDVFLEVFILLAFV